MTQTSIYKEIWQDDRFAKLSSTEKLFVIYCFTNANVKLVPIFFLSDRIIKFDLGLTDKELISCKDKAQVMNIYFYESYCFVKSEFKPFTFKGNRLEKAKQDLYRSIPENVRQYFKSDTLSIPYRYPIDTPNRNRSRNNNSNSNNNNLDSSLDIELEKIVKHYNETFNKNVQSTAGFKANYLYWRTIHNTEKILNAISGARNDKFWREKLTLVILFRKKNPRGEDVDYVEDLSSRKNEIRGNIAIL